MATVIGAIGYLALMGGSAYAGYAMSQSGKSGKKSPTPEPMPVAPKEENIAEKAQDINRAKLRRRSQSVYTSPLGVKGEADISRKTLLGQ